MAYGGAGFAVYGPLAAERAQQVDELLRQFPSLRPVNADRSVFDLPLELKDKKATALRITLPPHFPQERPGLSVLLPVIHPSVDPAGRVHTTLLAGWVYGASRLSSVVAEAVAALTEGADRQPDSAVPYPAGYPVPAGPLAAGRPQILGTLSSPRGRLGSASSSPTRQLGAATWPPQQPATSSAVPDFSRFSAAQLEELLRDQAAFQALLRDAIRGSAMAATLEDIRSKNRQLAESNIAKQDAVSEVRNQLAVVKSSEYTLIKSRFDALHERQARVLATMGGLVWREKLEEAVSAVDAASSALAADFLAGDLAVEEFVSQHVELRTKHHALDLKRQAAEQLLTTDGTPAAAARGGVYQ